MTRQDNTPSLSLRHCLTLLVLIMAGEAVFFLPYVIIRLFRPTFLEVFGLTNLQLGLAFSAYGMVAMVSYALGGPLADRYSARHLMTIALAATAAGGLLMIRIPSLEQLTVLYAFWGLTSVLLFWAALIRTTREWGGESRLGSAYGWLDGGRGLYAALIGAAAYALFAWLLPDVESASLEVRRDALQQVIGLYTVAVFMTGLLVWWTLPVTVGGAGLAENRWSLRGIRRVIALPTLWLQAVIIVCAYAGYKSTDDISLYAREVLGLDEVRAAGIGAAVMWMRPVACILAGWLADKTSTLQMTLFSWILILLGSGFLASGVVAAAPAALFLVVAGTSAAGIYALRGLYFAIMGVGKIPVAWTGTAVGIVSTIGYTPDIFMGPLMGYLLDRSPGPAGHFDFFTVVTGFALVGLLATLAFRRAARHRC